MGATGCRPVRPCPLATRKAADNGSQSVTAFCILAGISADGSVSAGLTGIDGRAEVILFPQ